MSVKTSKKSSCCILDQLEAGERFSGDAKKEGVNHSGEDVLE